MSSLLLIVVLSYLLGSIPFGYLLVRIFHGEDVRLSGSGNIGATNVARKSPLLGIATLLLDALKGAAAVWIAHIVCSRRPGISLLSGMAAALLFAVLGHMFPIWLKFSGGKGVATGLGGLIILAPKSVLVALGIFVAVVMIFRYVSLGSVVAAAAIPFLVFEFHEYGNTLWALAMIAATSLLIVCKHHENIGRLLAGTEHPIGKKSA